MRPDEHEPGHPDGDGSVASTPYSLWSRRREPFEVMLPATQSNARTIRQEFDRWLAPGVPATTRSDLTAAVYEAVANAAEHAYHGRPEPGAVAVDAYRHGDTVLVTVTDHGRWRLSEADVRGSGWGLPLMRHLTDDVRIDRTSSGTSLELRTQVS